MKRVLFLIAYLIGSIPFGCLISRYYGVNIQRSGSGNIGATNVFRTLGAGPGSLVFILDLLKGTAAVILAQYYLPNPWLIILAGLAAVLGHMYPLFLKFKGGKGAATGLGILLGIAPDIFFFALIIAILIIWRTKYVSLASITLPPIVTLAFLLLGRPLPYTILCLAASIMIINRHQANIQRLMNGTEAKFGGIK